MVRREEKEMKEKTNKKIFETEKKRKEKRKKKKEKRKRNETRNLFI